MKPTYWIVDGNGKKVSDDFFSFEEVRKKRMELWSNDKIGYCHIKSNYPKELCVLRYITPHYTSDLYFASRGVKKDVHFSLRDSLPQQIVHIFKLTRNHDSYDENGLECYSCASRSCIDIWRHLKVFNKDVTIFQVMRTIYKLMEEPTESGFFIDGGWCDDTQRMVFDVAETFFEDEVDSSLLEDWIERDEFGLEISDWKDIGVEFEKGVNDD